MTRSKRIQSIARLAQADEREAAARLAKTAGEVTEYEKKLEELKTSRQEYARQWQIQDTSMGAAQMKGLWVFIKRLDEVIANLETQIERKRHASERDRDDWLVTRNKVRALDNIVQQHRRLEARVELRKEQREVDDRAPGCSPSHEP